MRVERTLESVEATASSLDQRIKKVMDSLNDTETRVSMLESAAMDMRELVTSTAERHGIEF